MGSDIAVEAVGRIYEILRTLDPEARVRILNAVDMLLGTSKPGSPAGHSQATTASAAAPQAYFGLKEPRTKMEELAVAARYRETTLKQTTHTQKDLRQVIEEARRNFDAKNFSRDLENARSRSLFTRGTGKDHIVLSYHGQNYVDALPDRKKIRKPRAPRRPTNGTATTPS